MESISVLFSLFQFQLEIYANVTPGTAFLIEMTNKGESRFNQELEWANIKYVTISDTLTSYNLRMHQKRNKQCDKNKGQKNFIWHQFFPKANKGIVKFFALAFKMAQFKKYEGALLYQIAFN